MGRRSSSHHGNFSTGICQLRDFKIDFFRDKIEAYLNQNANAIVLFSKNVRKKVFFGKKIVFFEKKFNFLKSGEAQVLFTTKIFFQKKKILKRNCKKSASEII